MNKWVGGMSLICSKSINQSITRERDREITANQSQGKDDER